MTNLLELLGVAEVRATTSQYDVNLWAGTGFRSVRAQPAGEILKGLVP